MWPNGFEHRWAWHGRPADTPGILPLAWAVRSRSRRPRRYRSTVRRHLLTLAIFLLAGAVVNVAVAWVILWKKDWTTVWPARLDGVWHWPRDVPTHWPDMAETILRAEGFGVLGLSYDARRLSDAGRESFRLATFRAGWPMLGLAWGNWQEALRPNMTFAGRPRFIERSDGHPTQSWWVWGIPVELSTAGYGQRMRNHLPIRPFWPAFAPNTLFYATLLWLVILGPFALRRLIRQRRGLCPACGYDLRHGEHEACPECGVTG